MRKVGRNDPCHCGSGVKYKYCCLQKDQEEHSSSTSTAPSASETRSSFQSQTATSESQTTSPAEKAWESFEASDYEERRALVEEIAGDAERMDTENAFHMLSELKTEVAARGEWDWFTHILNRLKEEQPETYAAELPHLLSWHLEAVAVGGRPQKLSGVAAERVDDLATMATQNIDEFYPCIQLVAYHSSLAPIAEAMQGAWDAVREHSDIMPFAKNRFANGVIEYAILAHYEKNGTVDLENSSLRTLIDRIDATEQGEVDTDYVERFAARLAGPNDLAWQLREDPAENIHWLTVDFMCTVSEETDVPLGRAQLARKSIKNCHLRNFEGRRLTDPEDLLYLNKRDVTQQLDETGSFMSSHPHQRAAFFSLLPAWLVFLERRQMLRSEEASTMLDNLRALRSTVTDMVDRLSHDPTLVRDVNAAWE